MVLRDASTQRSTDNQYLEYLKRTMLHFAIQCIWLRTVIHRNFVCQRSSSWTIQILFRHARYLRRWSRDAWHNFANISKNYDRTRIRLTFALNQYDEVWYNFYSTCMNSNEVKTYEDRIYNDYCHAQNHFEETSIKYYEGCQYLDNYIRRCEIALTNLWTITIAIDTILIALMNYTIDLKEIYLRLLVIMNVFKNIFILLFVCIRRS